VLFQGVAVSTRGETNNYDRRNDDYIFLVKTVFKAELPLAASMEFAYS
jgi:hypothetical protein